jgi:hypothetical protein
MITSKLKELNKSLKKFKGIIADMKGDKIQNKESSIVIKDL